MTAASVENDKNASSDKNVEKSVIEILIISYSFNELQTFKH